MLPAASAACARRRSSRATCAARSTNAAATPAKTTSVARKSRLHSRVRRCVMPMFTCVSPFSALTRRNSGRKGPRAQGAHGSCLAERPNDLKRDERILRNGHVLPSILRDQVSADQSERTQQSHADHFADIVAEQVADDRA